MKGQMMRGKEHVFLRIWLRRKNAVLGMSIRPVFMLGKTKSKKYLKEKTDIHALETGRNLYYKKNDKLRLWEFGVVWFNTKSKSKGKEVNLDKVNCSWFLHASRSNTESPWFVRTLNYNNTCLQSRKIRPCTTTFISKKIMDQIDMNIGIPHRAL
uniref:Uncharacterized protein n=1 Tax=Lactuca sativa TaxID=4236 RepID=A0A9R1W6W2_LACSA|nr:hypothetical protein LSAT_V11C300105150 [Lactuca sativa]